MFYDYNPADKENRWTIAWLTLLFLAIYGSAIEAPVSFVLHYAIEEHNLWWDGILSIIFFIDVYLRLSKKLKLPENSNSYFSKKKHKVSTPYSKSLWLPVDVITSLPFDIIVHILEIGVSIKFVSLFRLLRIIRIIKLKSVINIIDYLPKIFKIILAISAVVLIIHWISCGWMVLNPRYDLDPWSFYNISLYWTVSTLTTVGYGDITPHTNISRIYTMFVMLIGVASYGIVIGNFSRMVMVKDRYEEEKSEKMNALHKFMRYYNIPSSLQKEAFSIYHHLLNKNLSDRDHQVVNDLPVALQNELQVYMKIKLIKAVHIFSDCSIPCLKLIAQKLEQTYHSPNEYIIKKGDLGDEMFIIGHGEVEVSNGEKVLTTLKDGQFFGEIAILRETVRNSDIRTKTYCDLYTFKKSDYLDVIEKYPHLNEKLEGLYERRRSQVLDKNAA